MRVSGPASRSSRASTTRNATCSLLFKKCLTTPSAPGDNSSRAHCYETNFLWGECRARPPDERRTDDRGGVGWACARRRICARVDYVRDIKPILAARCTSCHGAIRQKAGLRLDTAEFARRGGEGGPAVEPGKSGESLLIDRVTGADGFDRMPPESEGVGLSQRRDRPAPLVDRPGCQGPAGADARRSSQALGLPATSSPRCSAVRRMRPGQETRSMPFSPPVTRHAG